MPYTIKPDGSVVCDTPDEALKMQRAIMARQATASDKTPQAKLDLGAKMSSLSSQSTATRFLDLLRPYNGSTIDSTHMAKILETGITGVGTKLRHVKSSFLSEGKQLDDYLVPCKTDEGYAAWKIRIKSTLPSA